MQHQHTASSHAAPLRHQLRPWLVWGLGCLFYFYEFFLQVSPSVMNAELMRDFSVTSHTLGVLSGVYFYSYAAMQLPGGMLLDYFGPRRLLTIATLICALSTLVFGFTTHLLTACFARFFIGLGSAFAALGTMKLAANWFKPEKFALLTGIMVTIGMLGAIGGEAPLALLVDTFGWRESMFQIGIVGLILAVIIYAVVKDNPKGCITQRHAEQRCTNKLFNSLLSLLKNQQLWLIAIYGGFIFMVTPVFCGLWGVPFIMLKMNVAKTTAAHYISLVFVGWAIASPLWGVYSNKIGKRKPPLYIGCIGAMLTSLIFIYVPLQSAELMQLCLFLFGVFSAGFLPAFAVAKELCDKRYVATGLSFMNMMNMIGIAIVQPLIGYILDLLWQGEILDSVRVYPLSAYHTALAILPAGMLISLITLFKIRETYCVNINEVHGEISE